MSRHGEGHLRLSNHVTHRANIWALKECGSTGVLGVTVCGAVDPTVPLGSLICFDDLHFLVNRLADGSICTFYAEAGDAGRGHWIYEDPFSAGLRSALLSSGVPMRDGGCYGHVTARASTPRRRSARWRTPASPRSRRRPAPRPSCAVS